MRYLYILERKVNPALHWTGIDTKQMWFQQDEANPHTTTAWLISYRRHLETGSLHSGLTTIGHHIRFESTRCLPAVIIKRQVNKLLQNSEKYKGEHQAGNQTETCQAVISNVKKRCDVVIEQNGRHVEHVL